MAPVFMDFRRIRKRIRRTLNYGDNGSSKLNKPLSDLVVTYFDHTSPFDNLQPETSAKIASQGYVDPCTLIVALVYLDRLRDKNKTYFESTDPAELYLPALLLASKFLHDTDTQDRATNSDWASATDFDKTRLNKLEWDFVEKLDWQLRVQPAEFESYLHRMERWVAHDTVNKTGGKFTYNELLHLSEAPPTNNPSSMSILHEILATFGVLSLVYSFSFLSLLSTCQTLAGLNAKVPQDSAQQHLTQELVPQMPLDFITSSFNENEDSEVCESLTNSDFLANFNFEPPCPLENPDVKEKLHKAPPLFNFMSVYSDPFFYNPVYSNFNTKFIDASFLVYNVSLAIPGTVS